jgi:MFS family permease
VPAIGQLAKDLNTSAQNVTWTLTAYLVSAAVLTPVLGWLGDMFGKRRMLVISLLVFAAGGALAALGGNPGQVVTGRVLQGAGGGIFPLCFGIVRDEFPAKPRPGAVGPVSAIAGIGGGLGLLMGGLLVDHASYHWIFWSGAFDDRVLVDALAQGVISAPGFSPDTMGAYRGHDGEGQGGRQDPRGRDSPGSDGAARRLRQAAGPAGRARSGRVAPVRRHRHECPAPLRLRPRSRTAVKSAR